MPKFTRWESVKIFLVMIVCGSVFAFVDAHWAKERLEIKKLQEDVEMSRMMRAKMEENLWKAEMRRLGIEVDN